jgi:hypothetical protein
MVARHSIVLAVLALGCSSEEAPRVSLPVVVDASGVIPVTNDVGYVVTVTRARTALRDLQFTVGGEAHVALIHRVARWIVPVAHAHPGHQSGGDVTGELPGPVLVDWLADGAVIGQASLIVGRYGGANFTFRRASAADVPAGDPIVGHTIAVEGTASKGGRTVAFSAVVDVDEGAQLVGAAFEQTVDEGTARSLGLRLLHADPTNPADTLWNGVDFFAIAAAEDHAAIAPGQESHNLLRRVFQVHDHYDVRLR